MEKSWFDLKEIRKRRLVDAVWIPLRASELVEKAGTYGYPGFKEEFFGLGSVAIPIERRGEAEKLGWSELSGSQGSWACRDFYKPAGEGSRFGAETNDYPAKLAGAESIRVRDPHETKRFVEAICACLETGDSHPQIAS